MTDPRSHEVSSFWYGTGVDERAAASVLQALRAYRAAEMELRRRTRASMGMSDNEMLVVGLATRRARAGRELQPRDVARELGLTTASVTGLLDKLERSGHIRREPHPTDRRRLCILPTPLSDTDVRASLGTIHERMMSVARTLPPADAAVVTEFLRRMSSAIADASPSAA
ncbi:MarR family winged helix-turn-helix transcriptional regulator [Microbacterium sp. NPDC055683]